MSNEKFAELIALLQEHRFCGEIYDREGYVSACVMSLGHIGEHGWNAKVGSIRLYCKSPTCKDFGGFITRSVEDAAKIVFTCDVCRIPMAQGNPKDASPEVSKKKKRKAVIF